MQLLSKILKIVSKYLFFADVMKNIDSGWNLNSSAFLFTKLLHAILYNMFCKLNLSNHDYEKKTCKIFQYKVFIM